MNHDSNVEHAVIGPYAKIINDAKAGLSPEAAAKLDAVFEQILDTMAVSTRALGECQKADASGFALQLARARFGGLYARVKKEGIVAIPARHLRDTVGAKRLGRRVRERLVLVLDELGISFGGTPEDATVPEKGYIPANQNDEVFLWLDGEANAA